MSRTVRITTLVGPQVYIGRRPLNLKKLTHGQDGPKVVCSNPANPGKTISFSISESDYQKIVCVLTSIIDCKKEES